MAPPVGAWRRYPPNRGFNPSSAAAKRLNDGFTARPTRPRLKAKTKTRAPLGKLRGKMGKKGWMAAGMVPVVAGLGALLGSVLKPKSNKKQEGRGNTSWRVLTHQPFLLTLTSNGWGRQIQQASTEELRALTDLIRQLRPLKTASGMYRSMIKSTQKESSVIVLFTRKVTALGIKYFPVSEFLLFGDLSG